MTQIPPELDVRKIMLSVSPGWDGMGEEIYAKNVTDVIDKLTELGAELEEWQLGIRRLPAPVQEPTFLGYMNAVHLQKMQQGLLQSGYVYRDGGGIDEVAVFAAPQALLPKSTEKIKNLIARYWDLAYNEGKEGRTHDTPDGNAGKVWQAIEDELNSL